MPPQNLHLKSSTSSFFSACVSHARARILEKPIAAPIVTSIFLRKLFGTVLPLIFAIRCTITSASSILFLLRSHRGDSGMIQ